jgi:predicted ester cyclase
MMDNGNDMYENAADVEATAAFYKAHIEQEWESHKVQHKIVHDNSMFKASAYQTGQARQN